MTDRIFRYVAHWRRSAYEACGWAYSADLGPTHGQYSCLMEWVGDGEPRSPLPHTKETRRDDASRA